MTATTPSTENPFHIREAIERVAEDNEGLYLTRQQKYVLLDYIVWNATVVLLVSLTPYSDAKLFGQYGDGTNFTADGPDSDTMAGLRKLRTHIVRRGALASRPDAEYVLHLLPAGRWASSLCDWIAPQDEEYAPLEPVADVLAMAAALAMISDARGAALLDRVRQHAITASSIVLAQ